MGGAADKGAAAARRRIFEVDQDAVLEALHLHWGDAYDIAIEDGLFTARRRGADSDVFTGMTPDELTVKIRADWARAGTL
jgi:hypothetical protein